MINEKTTAYITLLALYGELADYVAKNVSIQSLKINTKEQDPVVNTSEKIQETWREWKF